MNTESRPNIKKIRLGYIASMVLLGAIISGFLFLFQDDESRFRWGGVALAVIVLLANWLFDIFLPKEISRLSSPLLFLDIMTLVLIYCFALYVGGELGFTEELFIELVANPLVWLMIWGVLAIGRLKDYVRFVEQEKLVRRES